MYHAARIEKRKETAITVYSTVLLDDDSSVDPSATPRYTIASCEQVVIGVRNGLNEM
jgi:hypothetical protein